MCGDWEAVRQELGVEGLGLPMPETTFNTFRDLKNQLGNDKIDMLAKHLLGSSDEANDENPEAAFDYESVNSFAETSEAREFVQRHGWLQWAEALMHFGEDYLGTSIEAMTLGDVQEFIQDYVPRKVTTEPESAPAIIEELTLFWQFLDNTGEYPAATSIVNWLNTAGLAAQLQQDLADPSKFGMAKSLFSTGAAAGFDMTSEAGIAEFMAMYNQTLSAQQEMPLSMSPIEPVHSKNRVGRNDPCTCGSGKKYKKCCGRLV